jgi:hypothetical protein
VDWLRVLDLRRANDHLQSGFWQRVVPFSSSRRGGFSGGHLHRLGGFYGSLLSPWCYIFNEYRRRDIASLGLNTCRQEDKCIIPTWRLRLLFRATRT